MVYLQRALSLLPCTSLEDFPSPLIRILFMQGSQLNCLVAEECGLVSVKVFARVASQWDWSVVGKPYSDIRSRTDKLEEDGHELEDLFASIRELQRFPEPL